MLSNEGADPSAWWGLWHYYHLTIENILGGFAGGALAMPQPAVPDRLAIPWVEGWHDRWGMNDAVTTAVFGQEIIEKAQWELMSNERLFFSKGMCWLAWLLANRSDLCRPLGGTPQVEARRGVAQDAYPGIRDASHSAQLCTVLRRGQKQASGSL